LIEGEITRLQKEYADLEEVLRSEKAAVQGAAHYQAEIDRLRRRWPNCTPRQFDKVAEIQLRQVAAA